jgi:hypothetical protein
VVGAVVRVPPASSAPLRPETPLPPAVVAEPPVLLPDECDGVAAFVAFAAVDGFAGAVPVGRSEPAPGLAGAGPCWVAFSSCLVGVSGRPSQTSPPETVVNSSTQSATRPALTVAAAATQAPIRTDRRARACQRPDGGRAPTMCRSGTTPRRRGTGSAAADRSMVVVRASAPDLALRPDRTRAPVSSGPSNRDSSEPPPDGPSEGAAAPGATATTANLLLVGRN